jgi:hypothetical protein
MKARGEPPRYRSSKRPIAAVVGQLESSRPIVDIATGETEDRELAPEERVKTRQLPL